MEIETLEIYYIRHADAATGKLDGRDECDKDVTPLGEKQLELLSERFKGAKIDAILASPLVRTVKTAAAVANGVGGNIPIEIIPEIIEKGSTPGYKGLPLEELKKFYGNLTMCKDKIHQMSETEKETKEECLARARAVVEYLKNRFDFGQRIVIASHGTFANNFHQAAMGIVNEYDFRLTTDNTGVTKLEFQSDGVKRILFHNDLTHLIPIIPEYKYRF